MKRNIVALTAMPMKNFLACITCLCAFIAATAQQMYICTGMGDLFLADADNCSHTLIGNSGMTFTDIALSPSGTLYGTDGHRLYKVSTFDASPELVYTLPINGPVKGMVCDAEGNIYFTDHAVYKLDVSTSTWACLGLLAPYQEGLDLVFHEARLYVVTSYREWVEVHLSPFSVTYVGYVAPLVGGPIYGLAGDGSPVFDPCAGKSVTEVYAAGGSEIYRIDPRSALLTLSCQLPLQPFDLIFGAASPGEYDSTPVDGLLHPALVPNVFTPNADGVNDLFIPFVIRESRCSIVGTFAIYDRWGLKVSEGSITETWNGNDSDGNPCGNGTYYYVLEWKPGAALPLRTQGFVTLLR
jgi:gliding motility-associated-like protein